MVARDIASSDFHGSPKAESNRKPKPKYINKEKLYKGTALFMKLVFSSCERVSLDYNLESASANSVY